MDPRIEELQKQLRDLADEVVNKPDMPLDRVQAIEEEIAVKAAALDKIESENKHKKVEEQLAELNDRFKAFTRTESRAKAAAILAGVAHEPAPVKIGRYSNENFLSALVNRRTLAERARALGLRELVRLGRTEERSQGRDKESILANCFEAVIGALYLDGGLEPALVLVSRCFAAELAAGPAQRDAKTAFQEWAHAKQRRTPTYYTVGDTGVENDESRFTVEVRLAGETYGRGVGRTKRAAEAAAAEQGLLRVGERQ